MYPGDEPDFSGQTQPLQTGGSMQSQYPQTQQPQRRSHTAVIVASIVCVSLVVTAIALALIFTGNDSPDSTAAPVSDETTTVIEKPGTTLTQTQTVAPAPPPAPMINNAQAALNASGFVYPCTSSIYRQRTGTTCAWAQDVQYEVQRRGGTFSSVPIYSAGAGTTIYTSCHDAGYFYQCTGRNSTIAILK
ncbi:hypothetical protein ACFQNE_03600 [Gordonia phosphorivorans]|uniref:Ig-like domain-containing protein n=1 Tax=Gordonia phosphorivorans TaxID=1056982 RepID=A0ABV6H8W2_9ACTN